MNAAEWLLDLAERSSAQPGKIIFVTETAEAAHLVSVDVAMARVELALALRRLPTGVRFRAMVEGWSMQDIVREVY